MGAYFTFVVVVIECIHVIMGQCPTSPGPVIIVGTSIGNNYRGCGTITSVEIPSTVVNIGKINYNIIFIICEFVSINVSIVNNALGS